MDVGSTCLFIALLHQLDLLITFVCGFVGTIGSSIQTFEFILDKIELAPDAKAKECSGRLCREVGLDM